MDTGASITGPVATAWDAGRRLGLSSFETEDSCLHLVLHDVRPDGKTKLMHLSSYGHRMLRARVRLDPVYGESTRAQLEFALRKKGGMFPVGAISECVRAFMAASMAWGTWPEPEASIATKAWDALVGRCGPACLAVLADDGAPGWLAEADALMGAETVDRLLTLYPFLAGPLRGYVREQAKSSFPLFESLDLGDLSPKAVSDAVIAILDGDGTPADPLSPAPDRDDRVGRRKAVTRALSRLRGITLPAGIGPDVLRSLGHVPYDWIPGDAEGAVGMAALVRAAATLSKASGGALAVAPLLAPVKGRWHEAHSALLARNPGVLQDGNFPDWTSHIADMVQAFRSEVLAPVVLHADAIPSYHPPRLPPSRSEMDAAAWKGLFEGMGLASVLKASHEWHRRSAHITQGIMAIERNAGLSWPSPFDAFTAPNGLTVVPMLSSDDLIDEGIALLHCVAGYAAGCHEGRYAIGSVRSGGRRTSTVQLAMTPGPGGRRIEQSQHRGFHNGDPSPEDEAAVEALVDHLRAAFTDTAFPSVATAPAPGKRKGLTPSPVYERHPYDPRPRESVERAIHLWSWFLPRTARDPAGVVALVDVTRVHLVIDEMARSPVRKRIRHVLVGLRMRFLRPWHPPGTEWKNPA